MQKQNKEFCTLLYNKKTEYCRIRSVQSGNSSKYSELLTKAACFQKHKVSRLLLCDYKELFEIYPRLLLHGSITTDITRTIYTFNRDDRKMKNTLVKGKEVIQ